MLIYYLYDLSMINKIYLVLHFISCQGLIFCLVSLLHTFVHVFFNLEKSPIQVTTYRVGEEKQGCIVL